VAVKIRLKRMGKIRAPYYRIVVADARSKRDGRSIEEIGKYHPIENPSYIEVDSQRAQYWLGVGAKPTEQVLAILKITGDWQRFKGEPGGEGTLQVAAAKPDKKAVFEAAAKEAMGEPKAAATTTRPKRTRKADETPDERAEPKAEESPDAPAEAVAVDVAVDVAVEQSAASTGADAGDTPAAPTEATEG
jgi:small subunit ribosomal protein S16